MARNPLSVLQILGFDMKLAVRENLAGCAYFSHAVRVAFHILVRDEFPTSRLKCASGHIATRGEVVKRNDLTRLIPNQQGFAAISAVIDRMKNADCLAVQSAFPSLHINGGYIGF